MSKASEQRAADRRQRLQEAKWVILTVLTEQPGITAYLLHASLPDGCTESVTQTLALLGELEKDGDARHEDDPHGARWYPDGNETGNEPGDKNRTGDEIMTPRKTPAEKARAKYLAAAKRALGQVVTSAAEHAAALDGGGVPAGSFMTHVLRYYEALSALAALSALGEPGTDADGLAEVSRDDLRGLVMVLQGFGYPVTDGTPMARLTAAAAGPPWDEEPAGPPAAEPASD